MDKKEQSVKIDSLENLCKKYFGEDATETYSMLRNFIRLNLPVNPIRPDELSDYSHILTPDVPSWMKQRKSYVKYELAALVALLKAEYEKAEEFLSEAEKQNDFYGEKVKLYSTLLKNKEKVHELLQEYYGNQLERIKSGESRVDMDYLKKEEGENVPADESARQKGQLQGKLQERGAAREGIRIGVLVSVAVALIGGGLAGWYISNSSSKKAKKMLEHQVVEYETKISDYEAEIRQLYNELEAAKEQKIEKIMVINYIQDFLESDQTISDKVVDYLTSLNFYRGKPLPYPLIKDYCFMVYDVMGISRENAGQYARNLPVGAEILIPVSEVSYKDGKWCLTGSYVRRSDNKLINFELKQEKYLKP